MTSLLKQSRDATFNDFSLSESTDKFACYLTANTQQSITVPQPKSVGTPSFSKNQCVGILKASEGMDVWYSVNTNAVVPGGTFSSSVMELINGQCRSFTIGDVIHVISPDAAGVSITFYATE